MPRLGLNKLPEERSGGGDKTGGTLGHLKGCKHCVTICFPPLCCYCASSEESRKQVGVGTAASPFTDTPGLRTEVGEAGYGRIHPASKHRVCSPGGQLGEQEAVKAQVPRRSLSKLRAAKAGSAMAKPSRSWASTTMLG